MDAGAWIGVGGLAVAVVAVVASWMAARRFGNRRRSLTFTWRSTRLLNDAATAAASGLVVSYRGEQVTDARLLLMWLTNSGPADIASDHFDRALPLEITVHATVYGLIPTEPSNPVELQRGPDAAVILIRPSLIPRGSGVLIGALVEGDPTLELVSPLIDTDVRSIDRNTPSSAPPPVGGLLGFTAKVLEEMFVTIRKVIGGR